jgi:SAM-dependent methyltransferase
MSKTHSEILDKVYDLAAKSGAKGLYKSWAEQYDADNAALGFRLPSLGAGFVARYAPVGSALLDAGCGTGLVARDLTVLGYKHITGIDLSEEMLDIAKGTGCYTALSKQELGTPLPFDTGQFGTTACFGSFGPGHAPPSSLYELSRVTAVGGYVIFNVVEHCYKELGFIDVMFDITTQGRWQLIEETKPFQPYTNGEPDLFTRIFVFKIVT